MDGLIRQVVSIDDSQFGFVPGRGTADAIFVIRQLQEKYLAANKRLYMAFVELAKAFDRVPRKVIWWALRKLGVDEWIVPLIQGMYSNARSRVHVGEGYSEEFEVKVGVHQGSVLSPLLFIIVLEALSCEFGCGVPWEDLYADDLVIIAESLEECVRRLLTWKEAMEEKSLRVNAGKTKIMICGSGLHAGETWPLTKLSLQCLQRNDRAMIRQICNVKPQDTATIRSTELLAWLGIEDLDLILKERRLRWYGHMERSNGAVKTAFDI